jgi:hypothetical protein
MQHYDWDKYQAEAMSFAIYKNNKYPTIALIEEIGEVAGKVAKYLRGDQALDVPGLQKEIGDVIWCMAAVCREGKTYLSYSMNIVCVDLVESVAQAVPLTDLVEQLNHSIGKSNTMLLTSLSEIARYCDTTLEECAEMNLAKLRSRKERDVIKGDGDNR